HPAWARSRRGRGRPPYPSVRLHAAPVTRGSCAPPNLDVMPHADPLRDLGVRLTADGGELRVWSANATAIQLCILEAETDQVAARVPLARADDGVWAATSAALGAGTLYALSVDGPAGATHAFDPEHLLLDPYARGLVRTAEGAWRATVPDTDFDWGGVTRPGIPLDRTVIYEAHLKGLTRLNPELPEQLRGTYAGLAHPATIAYLRELGVTAI